MGHLAKEKEMSKCSLLKLLSVITVICIVTLSGCNLITGRQTYTVIEEDPIKVNGRLLKLSISGSNVVWLEAEPGIMHDNDKSDINLYNLETHSSRTITSINAFMNLIDLNLEISGSIIVWGEYSKETDYDIWAYDLNKQGKIAVCTEYGKQYYPRIANNYILWRADDKHEGYTNYNYYFYDLMTGETSQIIILSKKGYSRYAPQFEGDIVAWQGIEWIYAYLIGYEKEADTDGKTAVLIDKSLTTKFLNFGGEGRAGDLYAYDYEQQNKVRLPRTWAYTHDITVGGDYVVWAQGDSQVSSHIYGYDLTTKKKFSIATVKNRDTNIAIDGNTIVWYEAGSIHIGKIIRENLN
jgi:hypothetical protein